MAAAYSTSRHAAGFTLLEMLLVLFLLGLMASTGLMLSEGVEDQAKYDETKRRMEMIRRAVIGDAGRSINGTSQIGGFVADMGRLPVCLAELLAAFDCGDPPNPLIAWNNDANSGLAAGWRGPYIQVLPDFDGVRRFSDAYGNDDGGPNFGWGFGIGAGAIKMQSAGLNGLFDGIAGGDDYPAVAALNLAPALIGVFDYRVDFKQWNAVEIRFENRSNAALTVNQNSLRLVLNHADDGQSDAIRRIDSTGFPAADLLIPSASAAGSLAVTAGSSVTVPAGAALNGTTLNIGSIGDLVFSGGKATLVTGDSIQVPAGSMLTGNDLAIGANGNITLPAASVVTLNSGLASPPNVYGYFSLIVACQDVVNVTAVDGKRFDGDCSRYGTDAGPNTYTPQNLPHLFSAAPRSGPILPPSPLIWSLQ